MSSNLVLDLLEQPPIELLLAHMEDVRKCVSLMPELIDKINDGDWGKAKIVYQSVVDLEQSADKKKQALRKLLRKDLILQIPKREILKIILEQDKLANFARDVCGLMLWRNESWPKIINQQMYDFATAIVDTCTCADSCLKVFSSLFGTVFSKDNKDLLDLKITDLENAESMTDALQCNIRGLLLSEETKYPPVHIVCLYDIINIMGNIADHAQAYGHFLFVCVSD